MQHKAADETERDVIPVNRSACSGLQVCFTAKTGSVRYTGKQTNDKVCMSWMHLVVIRKGHVPQPLLQGRAVPQHLHHDIDTAVVAASVVEQANPWGTCPVLPHQLLCVGLLPALQQVLSASSQDETHSQ